MPNGNIGESRIGASSIASFERLVGGKEGEVICTMEP
jgi:hypothetical protein